MESQIIEIKSGSCADRHIFSVGDRIVSINGHKIVDVLDYKFFSYDAHLRIQVQTPDNKLKLIKLNKDFGEDLGLDFETYLMDKPKACANRCLFCFVDQLPKGMRKTLYFKDDDARLSFLQGNYITLTNLSEREIQRICDLHISPINVSVHAAEPDLRAMLLGNKNGARGMEIMQKLAMAGITMNCQIVCCPGINDAEHLMITMKTLAELYPEVPSVSVVPVGLTCHRENLYKLTPFDEKSASDTIDMVENFAEECLEKYGSRIFFCADELYLKAHRKLPDDDRYEGYPQLENGVGLLTSLSEEFENAYKIIEPESIPFTAITGVSAAPYIEKLFEKAKTLYPHLQGKVIPIVNDFFGHTIDVAGLVTGKDIISQAQGKIFGQRILIPRNMLRHGEGTFLDDITIDDLERTFGVPVRIVEQDGEDLAKAFYGK